MKAMGTRASVPIVVAAALALAVTACGGDSDEQQQAQRVPVATTAAAENYAQAPAQHLKRPFAGAPVPPEWYGLWRSEVGGGDVEIHILAATSPECRGLTRGRTTCSTVGPRGASTKAFDIYAGGSLTRRGGKLIFRMTYNPNPNSPQCFDDDPYPYRYTARPPRIYVLLDDRPSGHAPGEHCHFERSEALANPKLRRLKAFEVLSKSD